LNEEGAEETTLAVAEAGEAALAALDTRGSKAGMRPRSRVLAIFSRDTVYLLCGCG
jgi:hypothetical protein